MTSIHAKYNLHITGFLTVSTRTAGGSQTDAVVYLFGNKTPGGNRLQFRPAATFDYRDYISTAVDQMHHEPVFVEALNMTSEILSTLLCEDITCQLLPAPGEHAPAA